MSDASFERPSAETSSIRYEIVSSENPRVDLVQRFYDEIICRYFLPQEREEVELWMEAISSKEKSSETGRRCKWALCAAIVDQQVGEDSVHVVVGGAVLEFYHDSHCALIPYLGVSAACRGQGVATQLLERGHNYLTGYGASLASKAGAGLLYLFLEVLQVRDEDAEARSVSGFDAKTRQGLWERIGFLPVEKLDLVHPGRLRGHRYHLAIYKPRQDTVLVVDVLRFMTDEFLGILGDEGNAAEIDQAMEPYISQFKSVQMLHVGPQWWR